jgi:transcriptional regulator of acetoin/glycerol metabolism
LAFSVSNCRLPQHGRSTNYYRLSMFPIATAGRALSLHTPEHLIKASAKSATSGTGSISSLADAERAHVTAALRARNWVIGGSHGAAAQLAVPRTTLIYRMEQLGVSNGMSRARPVRDDGG